MNGTQKSSPSPRTYPDPVQREPPIVAVVRFDADSERFETGIAQAARPEAPRRSLLAAACQITLTLDYMRTHLDQAIRISTLSTMVGLTQSSFFVLFRKVTGDTPLNWFLRARMYRAGELLTHTNLLIKQIADQVGYQDPLYFSRVFKSMQGIPPTKYRAQKATKSATDLAA